MVNSPDNNICPICSNKPNSFSMPYHTYVIDCSECGEYEITEIAYNTLTGKKYNVIQRVNASGWLRENPNFCIDTVNLNQLFNHRTPSVFEKAEKLMIYLAEKFSTPGEIFSPQYAYNPLSITWSPSSEERLYIVIDYLRKEKLFLTPVESGFKITPSGWSYLESLKTTNPDSNIGFVAMWFDNSMNDIWKSAIYTAIKDAGFDPVRIDLHEHNNQIVDEIITNIRRSKFVVADFTGNRGSVYFEAGYALGLGVPIIFTCKNIGEDNEDNDFKNLRFDIEHFRFTTWNEPDYDKFKTELQNRIEATIGVGKHKK